MSDTKFTKEAAEKVLTHLDSIASEIIAKYACMGLDAGDAKTLVNDLDRVADLVEVSAFGPESFERRRQEVVAKKAKVIQQDSDESYMRTFDAPSSVHQQDADEGYMSAFKDDDTAGVSSGKSTTGRPLAPLSFWKAHADDH